MSNRQNQRNAQPSSGVPRNQNNNRRGQGVNRGGVRPQNYRAESYNDRSTGENLQQNVEVRERVVETRDNVRTGPLRQPPQPRQMLSTTSSAPRDDPMYDGDAMASRPTTTQLGHNLDFSSFAPIIEETYRQCESENPRMGRELPFCMYQHAMVEHLNAYLIHQQKFDNADVRFQTDMDPLEVINAKDFQIPKVVHSYISGIGRALTPAGEAVRVNLPAAGTPRITEDVLSSGSFGGMDAVTHSAYECYWSPFVSKKLIERTVDMNTRPTAAGRNFGDWNPFPPGNYPAHAVFNGNLLGYHQPQRLHVDAINILNDCQFDESDTITGRLCHSAACIERTSMTLAPEQGQS